MKYFTKNFLGICFFIAVLAGVVYAGKEILGSMQPTNIASRVFDMLRIHDDIVAVTGELSEFRRLLNRFLFFVFDDF